MTRAVTINKPPIVQLKPAIVGKIQSTIKSHPGAYSSAYSSSLRIGNVECITVLVCIIFNPWSIHSIDHHYTADSAMIAGYKHQNMNCMMLEQGFVALEFFLLQYDQLYFS